MFARNLILQSAAGLNRDSNFNQVGLLLTGNGTNGAQNGTFIDSSNNTYSITRGANSTQGTFSPYGTKWSNYFDGSTGYLSVAGSSMAISTSSTPFTVEAWIYPTTTPNGSGIISEQYTSGANNVTFALGFCDGSIGSAGGAKPFFGAYNGSSWTGAADSVSITNNKWTHLVGVFDGTNYKLYVNGVNVATTAGSALTATPDNVYIGRRWDTGGTLSYFQGYISNARVVIGTAVYTGAFTSPVQSLIAISNTKLLTCQSNRFVDNSTGALTITINGLSKVEPYSPFRSPTFSYSTTTTGGSAYFDGDGDFLVVTTANTAFNYGTGNFTIAFWVYPTAGPVSTYNPTFYTNHGDLDWNSGTGTGVRIHHQNAIIGTSVSSFNQITYSTAVKNNTWTHIALVRNANTVTAYLNGVSAGNTTITGNVGNDLDRPALSTSDSVGPGGTGREFLKGFISNAIIIKGTALYTSNFTPPTSPITADSNTSLLLNFTNAGIYDSASMINLETAGNAQVSTTSPKFGTGSMYFDAAGADGAFLKMPLSEELNFYTDPFTVEFWMKSSGTQTLYSTIMDRSSSAPSAGTDLTGGVLIYNGTFWSNKINFRINNTTEINSTTNVNDGNWHHVACVRVNSTTMYLFVDGILEANSTSLSSTATASMSGGRIGKSQYNNATDNIYKGYIDDLRITKGIARYTSNFTPPEQSLPTY